MSTVSDTNCFTHSAATFRLLNLLSPAEQLALYHYLWMRVLQCTFPAEYSATVHQVSYPLANHSDWIGGARQEFQAEVASMYDLYGTALISPLTKAQMQAAAKNLGYNTMTIDQLRSRIAVAKCRFWRGNPYLPATPP